MADTALQDPGFFQAVASVIQSMEDQKVVFDYPNNGSDQSDDKAYIVHGGNMPSSNVKVDHVCQLVKNFLQSQISKKDYDESPEAFAFGATWYEKKPCFFFRWPEEKDLNFEKIWSKLSYYEDLTREASPEKAAMFSKEYSNKFIVGPLEPEDFLSFVGLLAVLTSYRGKVCPSYFALSDQDKRYFAFEKSGYLTLFEDEVDFNPVHPESWHHYLGGIHPEGCA